MALLHRHTTPVSTFKYPFPSHTVASTNYRSLFLQHVCTGKRILTGSVYTPTFSARSKFLSLWISDSVKIQLTARAFAEGCDRNLNSWFYRMCLRGIFQKHYVTNSLTLRLILDFRETASLLCFFLVIVWFRFPDCTYLSLKCSHFKAESCD